MESINDKLKLKPDKLEALIVTFEDEDYLTIESLKEISDEDFKAMNVPRRIYNQVKKHI